MDPISPLAQLGLGLGGVVVCTALFIWNTIELRRSGAWKETLQDLTKEMLEQRKLTLQMFDQQQKSLAKMSEQHTTLATNQLNLTNSVNEVVRELIDIIREVEKS